MDMTEGVFEEEYEEPYDESADEETIEFEEFEEVEE